MDIRWQLLKAIQKVLRDIGLEGEIKPTLEFPADITHGDYATSAALQYAKALAMPPQRLAEKLNEKLTPLVGEIAATEIAGPGFINFRLVPEVVHVSVQPALNSQRWGASEARGGEKVMVEYTDPNPFKEFHIGHLMSNAIGESLSRLLDYSGARVVRANWQGDVGPHVAKAIWGKMQRPDMSWGAAYAYGALKHESHKEEIDALNKKIYEKSDPAVNALYEAGRAESLAHFEELYKTLGTKFDHYFFEGKEGLEGVAMVKEGLARGVFEESEGAVVFRGEQYGLHTRVFLTSQGLPTYEAKELGLNRAKFEKEPDLAESVIVTASEQNDYFRVVLKAMEMLMPDIARKTKHVSHGMMRFSEGKMSSRTGNVITGESLIEDLTEAAKERARETRADDPEALARQVAVAAIKYQVLRQQSGKDIIFDRRRALSIEGDSGPYLQYAHARACAIAEKARVQELEARLDPKETPDELTRFLSRFPDIVGRAAGQLEPHLLANYLIEAAGLFNSWYAREQILDGTARARHKLAVVLAARRTLANGLWLLGIPAPERM